MAQSISKSKSRQHGQAPKKVGPSRGNAPKKITYKIKSKSKSKPKSKSKSKSKPKSRSRKHIVRTTGIKIIK